MASLDERPLKYRHCCCHVRVAAYILGILEALSVLYILVQHSVRSILAGVEQNEEKPHKSIDTSTPIAGPPSKKWLGAGSTTPLVTWAVIELSFLSLMIYGIAKERVWCLMPQIFLQIITIIVCMILNVLAICVLIYNSNAAELWYFLASTVLFAFLYEYGLIVIMRYYRYLREKNDHEQRISHSIYVLPTNLSGRVVSSDANFETRLYSDLPPEYTAAITMMTIEEANKTSRVTTLAAERKAETKSSKFERRSGEEIEQKPETKTHEERSTEENSQPPTYEEARKLQNGIV